MLVALPSSHPVNNDKAMNEFTALTSTTEITHWNCTNSRGKDTAAFTAYVVVQHNNVQNKPMMLV